MAFVRNWDADDIIKQLNRCASEMEYRGNDGYSQWGCKKDLLTVKYRLEHILRNAPTFSEVESEWIAEVEKQIAWEILKDKN